MAAGDRAASAGNSRDTAVLGVIVGLGEGCHRATGGTAGGQIGYRWQTAQWVFGIEGQGNWADFRGSNRACSSRTSTNDSRIDAFGLFTGQVGYAWNNVLFYVKGGAAVTVDRYRDSSNIPTGILLANTGDETRWGGTVGVGVEFGFAPNWSAGIEYDHLFMGNRNRQPYQRRHCDAWRFPRQPTASGQDVDLSRFASTTAWVARSSRSTDLSLN